MNFMDIFEEQKQKLQGSNAFQAQIMRQCWNGGSFWYFQAAHSPKGLCRVFNEGLKKPMTNQLDQKSINIYIPARGPS